MPCCCLKTLNLCNVGVCGILEIKQQVESGAGGAYTLLLDYMDTVYPITQDQVSGEYLKFDVSTLNENFQYTGQVYDLNGDLVNIVDGSDVYDCIKFKTVLNIAGGNYAAVPVLNIINTIVIEDVIGKAPVITGTLKEVTGLEADSNTITCEDFTGQRIILIRGGLPIPGIDRGDGSQFYTKVIGNDFTLLSKPLVAGEVIRLQTIPY